MDVSPPEMILWSARKFRKFEKLLVLANVCKNNESRSIEYKQPGA